MKKNKPKIELTNTKATAFYKYVRTLREQGENIMDILMDWIEKNDNDIEFVIELVKRDKELKILLEIEADNLKMFKKVFFQSKLDVE